MVGKRQVVVVMMGGGSWGLPRGLVMRVGP